jgi:hypothetical protein
MTKFIFLYWIRGQSKYSLRNTKQRGVVGNLYLALVFMDHI